MQDLNSILELEGGWYFVRGIGQRKWQCAFYNSDFNFWDSPTFVCNINSLIKDGEIEIGDKIETYLTTKQDINTTHELEGGWYFVRLCRELNWHCAFYDSEFNVWDAPKKIFGFNFNNLIKNGDIDVGYKIIMPNEKIIIKN